MYRFLTYLYFSYWHESSDTLEENAGLNDTSDTLHLDVRALDRETVPHAWVSHTEVLNIYMIHIGTSRSLKSSKPSKSFTPSNFLFFYDFCIPFS